MGVIASLVGLAGLSSVNSNVVTLDRRVTQPLSAFARLRDAEGDSRVNVGAYLQALTPPDRAAVSKGMATSDQAVATSVASYLAAHADASDERGRLMNAFAAKFDAWKHVRDTVVRPAADAGRMSQARAAVTGPLAAADEAMGAPLDTLFADEQTEAEVTAQQADREYASVRLELGPVLLTGVAVAVAVAVAGAWWLSRRMLTSIAVVREGLSRLAEGDLSVERPRSSQRRGVGSDHPGDR